MRMLIALLTLLLAFGLVFVGCENGTTSGVSEITVPGSNLTEKLTWLDENAESEGNYLIELDADESSAPVTLRYGDRTDITITLKGVDENRTISLSSNGSLFTVGSGVTLVLEDNITLKGRDGNNSGLLIVSGTLVMNTGSTITGNSHLGGVDLFGTFIMNGGSISNNIGEVARGVTIEYNNSLFTMNGGIISGNPYGGVSVNGTFTMNGGLITGNRCGVSVSADRTFTMNGGSISGNTSNGPGSGVHTWGIFTMNGGTISGNAAGAGMGGGGVCMDGPGQGTFTMTGGTISGNTSVAGGGVSVNGTFNMSGGTISGNTAGEYGGGITASANSTFTMSGGTITGNTAKYGGGIDNNGTFTKTGGIITGSDSENGNIATQSNSGNAVFAGIWNGSSFSNLKLKETTSGPRDNLSYDGSTGAFTGSWDN